MTTEETVRYREYDHLERLGHTMTEGILQGTVHVFPKLDGTNSLAWHGGSGNRKRVLDLGSDNGGFHQWRMSEYPLAVSLRRLLEANPSFIVYGEWLIKHDIKYYVDEAWAQFHIFDVFDVALKDYLHYDEYSPLMSKHGLWCIPPLAVLTNPTEEELNELVSQNKYLLKPDTGLGEGIVIKNYVWRSQTRTTDRAWAKILHKRLKRLKVDNQKSIEDKDKYHTENEIARIYVTPELVAKNRAKCRLDLANQYNISTTDGSNWQKRVEEQYRERMIYMLLGKVWHDLITEESWNFIKKFKEPVLDFRKLKSACTWVTKQHAADLFA